MKKTIHYININTTEYIKTKEIDTKFFGKNIPHTTDIKPLEPKVSFTVCFDKDKWIYKEDNRNKTVYDITNKTESKVDYLGVIKDGFTLLKPSQFDKWNGTSWVIDTNQELEHQKLEAQEYLSSTDWVEPYLIKHYLQLELIPEDSNKFVIEGKRNECKKLV